MSVAAGESLLTPGSKSRPCPPARREETSRATPRPRSEFALGFWLLVALLSLVAAGKVIQSDSMDPDAFWHLRVADQLARDGIRPLVDSISFASLKTPWTPYSWLAELFMRVLWNAGGFRLATLVTAVCSGGIIVIVAASSPSSDERRANGLSVVLLTAVAAFFTLPFISFRPVTFALVIFAAVVALLVRDRARATKSVWLVIPLTALMTNLHLYALLVPILLAATTIGTWVDDRRRFKKALILTFAAAAAACCTPMLGGLVTTALRYNAVDPMVAANYITEMRPFYSGGTGKVALVVFVALVLTCLANRKTLNFTDWLWLTFATTLLFRLGRFSPVFAIIATPVFLKAVPRLSGQALERGVVKIALVAIIAIALLNFWPSMRERDFDRWLNRNNQTYPTGAAQYVDTNIPPHTGRLLNEFNWGGYLAWRLNEQPAGARWQVLMDGRTQLYAPAFWNATHLGTPATRAEFLKPITADAALLPADGSCLAEPLKQLGWNEAYRDAIAVILVPPGTGRSDTESAK